MRREDLLNYIVQTYNTKPVYPFKHFPHYCTVEHSNGNWFGLIMNVEASKLGLSNTGEIDIVDLKVEPDLNSILQKAKGFMPAYHMSKKHWITVILQDFDTPEELGDLIHGSYMLTSSKQE